jgi:DNA-binding transcriptional ArsR family regulator
MPHAPALMTIGELASREGVTKQAISKTVKRLIEQHHLAVERDARGRVAKVDRENFDRLRHIHGDSTKRHEPAPPEPFAPPTNATLDGARREQIVEATRLTRLRLAAEAESLVRVDRVEEAASRLAEEIARQVDILPFLDDLIAAYQREDMHGVRMAAKRCNEQMRARIAEACAQLAQAAPARDDTIAAEDDVLV